MHTTEPTFGLPATWVDAALKEEASLKGYTVVDAATVLSTHLTELLKNNMSDLLSYGEVQKLLKDLPKEQGELVKDIVPSQITSPASSACCSCCWPSASRSATSRPSSKASPTRWRSRAIRRPWSSMSAPGWRARSARRTPRRTATCR
jgi:hypothetical protein